MKTDDRWHEFYNANSLKEHIDRCGSIRAFAKAIGVPESSVRYRLNMYKFTGQDTDKSKPVAGGMIAAPDARRRKLNGKRYVFTSAQNNTYVHAAFLDSLERFCIHKGAQLFISQFTYNKSGFQNSTKEAESLWYDPAITEYILNESVQVAEGLLFCGELDILPTAEKPLSGLETYCFGNSGIVPHAKVAMQSLPRLKGEDAKFLYTTGAVTQRNYIQRKVGQKAEFHHVFGALYVEIDDAGDWFCRQLIADNAGTFYDLDTHYTPEGIEAGKPVMAINWGDIHVEKHDAYVSAASWYKKDSMLRVLNPTYQFIHDLTDFTARNHHEIKDPYKNVKKFISATSDVETGLKQSAQFLENITAHGNLAVIVQSNHHAALERWLKEADGHHDPLNATFWHKANYEIFNAIEEGDTDFDVYEWAVSQYVGLRNVVFLEQDASFVICNDALAEEEGKTIGGIECGIHGHIGINGSRGSSNSFRTIGRKCNLGHSHTAGIIDGVYTAGVSGKLDMDYNKGASTWSHSHIVTYANGKRCIISLRNGKWHA